MDLLSANYAAPSLLFCERGMQDLHLKPSGTQGKKLHCSVVRSCGRIFGEVGDALDIALGQGGAVLYAARARLPRRERPPSRLHHVSPRLRVRLYPR